MSVQQAIADSSDKPIPSGRDEAASSAAERPRPRTWREPQGELSRLFTLAESPRALWEELTSTLEEFSATLRESRDRIARLSADLAQRDSVIATLKAKNLALEARLALAQADPADASSRARPPQPEIPDSPAEPLDAAKDGGIWRRLTRLERE